MPSNSHDAGGGCRELANNCIQLLVIVVLFFIIAALVLVPAFSTWGTVLSMLPGGG